MVWQTELVTIVRYLVDDTVCPYTFSDNRLETTILVASQLMIAEMDFATTYTVDTDQIVLTPDPTENTKDNSFINLVCLKAACIIARGEARIKANEGVSISDGLSRVDLTARAANYLKIAEQRCKDLDAAKMAYRTGNLAQGYIITGPFSHPDVNIADNAYFRDTRR